MFYLETKDGDKFFTEKDSDDRAEFEKIIEQKLGADAVELFNQILDEVKSEGMQALAKDIDYAIDALRDIRNELNS
jgi:hypothetical protein